MANLKQKEAREQLRSMSDEELVNEIAAQRANLFHLRRKNMMRQLDDTAAIRLARKQIARVLTILREREIAALKGEN
jgi:large subunit ribosomal protein L29